MSKVPKWYTNKYATQTVVKNGWEEINYIDEEIKEVDEYIKKLQQERGRKMKIIRHILERNKY